MRRKAGVGGRGGRERFPTLRERWTFRPQPSERLRDDLCKQGVSENKHPRVIFVEGGVGGGGGGEMGVVSSVVWLANSVALICSMNHISGGMRCENASVGSHGVMDDPPTVRFRR